MAAFMGFEELPTTEQHYNDTKLHDLYKSQHVFNGRGHHSGCGTLITSGTGTMSLSPPGTAALIIHQRHL